MKKITLMVGLALILVLPAVSVAKPTPDRANKRAAKSECNMFRGHSGVTREAFLTKYESFRACVKARARDEAQEEQSAHTNASRQCREERRTNPDFASDYGTNDNDRNAFGKCVSTKAKAQQEEADAEDRQDATDFKNAAKYCDNLRDEEPGQFTDTYGTEKNAFGKCVSRKARENHDENDS